VRCFWLLSTLRCTTRVICILYVLRSCAVRVGKPFTVYVLTGNNSRRVTRSTNGLKTTGAIYWRIREKNITTDVRGERKTAENRSISDSEFTEDDTYVRNRRYVRILRRRSKLIFRRTQHETKYIGYIIISVRPKLNQPSGLYYVKITRI